MSRRCLDSAVREMSIFEPSHCPAALIYLFLKDLFARAICRPPLPRIGTGLLASEPNDRMTSISIA
jgi:hypothetical protein